MLTIEQKNILNKSGLKLKFLTEERVQDIASKFIDIDKLSDDELVEFLGIANATYRGGIRIIDDADYDSVYIAELKKRAPNHPFLNTVEPEAAFVGKKSELPVRMLSTKKAYSRQEVEKWIGSVQKTARDYGIDDKGLLILITPKLDGFAAYDDGISLYTRGDGRRGTDVTRVFDRGLVVGGDGKRGHGAGEIVVDKDHFEEFLSTHFDNTRNFQAAILAEKKEDTHVQQAIDEKAAIFMPFSQLPSWKGSIDDLLGSFDSIVEKVWSYVSYDVDGVILEVTDEELKKHMGATQHHHRWQIALKANTEKVEVEVLGVVHETSRTGRVTPVVEIKPTRLSGATIQRATAHHYKMVQDKGIGPGAVIELVRSGLVIPKIERVIKQGTPDIPKVCPSCKSKLKWNSDNLSCENSEACPAQIEKTMEYFFKTLGSIDGFGDKGINKLYLNGVRSVFQIYQMKVQDFLDMKCKKENSTESKDVNCFGPIQSQNMVDQLKRSKEEPVEDWRFLASFGVVRMGTGNCEKLLHHYRLLEVFDLNESDIANVEGFAKVTAEAVVSGLRKIRNQFKSLYSLRFNLQATPLISELKEAGVMSEISGKQVVFTGSMETGSRTEMEAKARKLGAKVAKAVSSKTDLLVTGKNVGEKKITTAESKGVTVVSEKQYMQLIGNPPI